MQRVEHSVGTLEHNFCTALQGTVSTAVQQSIQRVAEQNGHLSHQTMLNCFDQQNQALQNVLEANNASMRQYIQDQFESAASTVTAPSLSETPSDSTHASESAATFHMPPLYSQFTGADNSTSDLPPDHDLGTGRHKLEHAWKLWIQGPEPQQNRGRECRLKPYRLIAGSSRKFAGSVNMQQKLQLRDTWKPFFRLCEACLNEELRPLPASTLLYPQEYIRSTYYQVITGLKRRVSFVFAADNDSGVNSASASANATMSTSGSALCRRKMQWESWSVATWARNTKPSMIMLGGVEADMQHLTSEARIGKGVHRKKRRCRH